MLSITALESVVAGADEPTIDISVDQVSEETYWKAKNVASATALISLLTVT